MKILLGFLLITIAFYSCSNEKKEQNFLNTYKDILYARETISDTAKANKKVYEILKMHDYTEASFREEFFSYAKDNDKMLRLMDSLRTSIGKEAEKLEGGAER